MSHNFMWCFPSSSSQLKTKIRDFLVQIAFTTEEYHPKIPILRQHLELKRDVESSSTKSVLFFNCDVDPALLSEEGGGFRFMKINLDDIEKQYFFSTKGGGDQQPRTHDVTFYMMSSQWEASDKDIIISLCADGNAMYEKLLRDQLHDEPEEPAARSAPPSFNDFSHHDNEVNNVANDDNNDDEENDDNNDEDYFMNHHHDDATESSASVGCTPMSPMSLLPTSVFPSIPKKIIRKPAARRRKVETHDTMIEEVDRDIFSLSEEDCHRLAAQASEVERAYVLKVFSTVSKANREDFEDANVEEIIQLLDKNFGDGKDGL